MAERIGFINFSYFDLPSINDFAVNKRISLRLEPHGRVKSLAESHPSLPPMRVEPPQLSKTPDLRQHALPSELQPLMDEYHRHIRMISQERAKIKFVLRRLKEDAKAVFSHYTQVDLLHQWKMNLQFQKIQRHMRLVHSVYLKIAHKKGVETERFMLEHNDKRDLENKIYPALHQLELKLPFRDEIKAPNQLKPVDHDKIRLKDNRQVSVDLKLHIEHLRQNLRLQLAAELKDLQRHTFQDKRQFTLAHLRWQNKLILRAYDKVSKHAS
ncbi:MAG: hypothetical protein NTX25_23840, partial [Proteobacteria bacterium]|nr:hypothetical protein [Pseudomonadota bacterium]